jgi:hypothetical protein
VGGLVRGTWLAARQRAEWRFQLARPGPFECFKTSPEVTRLAVMLCVRFPFSLRNVEDLLQERGV